jgi:hypothetical protein
MEQLKNSVILKIAYSFICASGGKTKKVSHKPHCLKDEDWVYPPWWHEDNEML